MEMYTIPVFHLFFELLLFMNTEDDERRWNLFIVNGHLRCVDSFHFHTYLQFLYIYIYPYELKIIFGIIIKFNNFSNNLVFSKQSFFFSLISNHTFFHKKGRISFETPH